MYTHTHTHTQDPADKYKTERIIGRMKAAAMVKAIKRQFRKDDKSVGAIVHTADPETASAYV